MKDKVEVLSKFKEFKEKIKKEVERKIQCLCTDNEIRTQFSYPSMLWQNEVVEKKKSPLPRDL